MPWRISGDESAHSHLPRRVGSIVPWLRGLVDLGAARRNRVGRLRGYGNAINIDVAVAFIRSVM